MTKEPDSNGPAMREPPLRETAMEDDADALRAIVSRRYADAARAAADGSTALLALTTQDACCEDGTGSQIYDDAERDALPDAAVAASLGCGNPTAVADLLPGDRVLDLGSGGGIDVLLSARRVAPDGFVYGLDMTEEMLTLARRNASEAGVENVAFLHGQIEAIPLPDDSVDVVISNCVVNLSPDKPAVLAEAARVLAPGGRVGITDIVADEGLSPTERAERGSWVGCIAGALSAREYRELLAGAGFTGIEIETTHDVVPGMSSAIIRAALPRR